MKDNIFDKHFKAAMQGAATPPPPNAWNAIAHKATLKRQRRVVMRNFMRYAAIILLLLTIGGSLWQFARISTPTTIEFNTPIVAYSTNVVTDMSNLPILTSTKRSIQIENIREEMQLMETQGITPQPLSTQTLIVKEIGIKKQSITPLTDAENIKVLEQYLALTNPKLKQNIYQPQNEIKKSTSTPIKYSLSCIVTPGYNESKYSSTLSNARGASYTNTDMKGGFNMGGGLKLVMQSGKRFSLQTGEIGRAHV